MHDFVYTCVWGGMCQWIHVEVTRELCIVSSLLPLSTFMGFWELSKVVRLAWRKAVTTEPSCWPIII